MSPKLILSSVFPPLTFNSNLISIHKLISRVCSSWIQFSHSVVSSSLWLQGLQEHSFPCASSTPRACSNSSIESVMLSHHLILCHPHLLPPSIFPSIRVFSNELVLHIRWPKYWSFSISPSNEHSGLISFRIVWFDLLNGLLPYKISSIIYCFLYMVPWLIFLKIFYFPHIFFLVN